jgi:excisionase family DNA binding protein
MDEDGDMLSKDREHPYRALLTVPEVASMLGCGRTLVYDLIGSRQLPVVKVGRLTRVPVAGVDAFVSRHLTEVAATAVESPLSRLRTVSSSPRVILDGRSRQAELFDDPPPRPGRRDGI